MSDDNENNKPNNNLPAVPTADELDEYERFAAEGNLRHLPAGALALKFNGQTGRWYLKRDPNDDWEGVRLICNPGATYHGWTKFEGEKPVDSRIVKVPAHACKRDELPDLDESLWPRGKDGKPQDFWSYAYYLPMMSEDGSETYIYITGSTTGILAVKSLIGEFAGQLRASGRPLLPCVKLEAEKFKSKYGSWLYKPILDFIGWYSPDGKQDAPAIAAKTTPAIEHHDDIDELEDSLDDLLPAPQTATRGKSRARR